VAPALGDDGTVYAGGDDSTLYAVDGATGRKKWEAPLEGRGTSSPCVRDGRVFIHAGKGSTENTIYALDAQDGSVTWSYRPARHSGHLFGGVGSACAPGNRGEIYVGNANGIIYALQGSLPARSSAEACQSQEECGGLSVDIDDDFIMIDGVKLPVARYMNPGGEWLISYPFAGAQ